MRNRMKQIANFAVLATASALAGCAGVQTPKEYAVSQGYSLVNVHGKKYYCRDREQPEVPGSPTAAVECLTRTQLSAKVAQLNSARFDNGGPPFDAQFSQFAVVPDTSAWQGSNNSTASGMGLANGVGAPR
jgi:hypothetical protein